jgi:hypothetical protein
VRPEDYESEEPVQEVRVAMIDDERPRINVGIARTGDKVEPITLIHDGSDLALSNYRRDVAYEGKPHGVDR